MTVRIGFKTSPQDVDWATVDATWRAGRRAGRGARRGFDSGWLNDHLTDMSTRRPRLVARGADAARDARPPRPGDDGRPRRPVEHVPRTGPRREGRDGPRPRDRRPLRPRASARAGSRASTSRSGSTCRRSGRASTGSSRPSRRSRPCSPPEAAAPPGVTRDDPFYPLERRGQRPAAADAGRPADLPRRPEAARDRARRPSRRRLDPARHARGQHPVLRGEA